MIQKISAVMFAGLLAAAAPHPAAGAAAPAASAEPSATSWAISVVLGSAGQVMQIGQAQASSGSQPNATATAFMAGGQGTGRVVADAAHPSVTKDFRSFTDPAFPVCAPPIPQATLNNGLCDPGGNFAIRGGFASAQTGGGTSNAQSGIANGNGNGFAFASKNFSFQQQTQVLNAIQTIDDQLAVGGNLGGKLPAPLPGLNPLIDQLNGATGTLPKLPHLSGPPPAGLIDIADTGAVSGTAQTSSAPGFVRATSASSLGDVKLIGGFIELHNVMATADSESNSGTDSRAAKATVGSISIAGLNLVADSDGLHFASNDLLTRAALQPTVDMLMSTLKKSGLTITFAQTRGLGDLQEATAFELNWITSGGLINISVGHADASAQSVGAPIIPLPGVPPIIGPPGVVPPIPGGGIVPPAIGPGPLQSPPANNPTSNFVFRRPGKDVARALHTVYLIFLIAGLIGSLLYPMFIKNARLVRRRPLLV
jgi:hypothetical protein